MQSDLPRSDTDAPPPSPPRFLGFLFGRRRTIVVDARYQLRVAATAAGLMLGAALLFAGAIHLEIARLHEIVSLHDPNIARALEDRGSIDLVLLAALGVGLTFAALLVALVETHRVAGPTLSLRRALERIRTGDYVNPVQLRRGDRLDALAESIDELREALASVAAEEADLLDSLAERLETAKGEDETSSIGAEIRDHAARRRASLGP
jgi:hypothetical protein